MFKGIMYSNGTYTIIDSHFKTDIQYSSWIIAVVREYHQRQLPLAFNIALYYKWISENNSFEYFVNDTPFIEEILPDIRYRDKYSNCIKRLLSK